MNIRQRRRVAGVWLAAAVLLCTSTAAAQSWVAIGPEGGSIGRLAQDVSNANVLYLVSATYPSKMYKSTNRGGLWSEIAFNFNSHLVAVEVNRKSPSEIYTCGYGNFFKSTNSGSNWTTVYLSDGSFYDLTPDSVDQNILHGCGYKWDSVLGVANMAYLKSTNKGANWTETVIPGTNGGYASAVAVEPKNSRRVWLGGYVYTGTESIAKVYRTTNGGANWTDVTGTLSGIVYDLSVDSTNVKRIIAVTSANVFRSTNNGVSWSPCTGYMYGNRITSDPKNRNTLYIGGSSAVYKSTDGGAGWTTYTTGLSEAKSANDILVDRTNSSIVFGGFLTGFLKSTDGGSSWTKSNTGLLASDVTTIELSSGASPALYAGVYNEQLYKTNNPLAKADQVQAVTWTKLPTFIDCHNLTDVQVLPTDPNVILAFEGGG